MYRMRWLVKSAVTFLVLGGALSIGGASATSFRGMAPKPAVLSAHHATIRTHVGSYCVNETPRPGQEYTAGVCADAAAPSKPPRPRLAVGPRDRLRIRFRDNPRIEDDVARVAAGLARIGDDEFKYVGGRVRDKHLAGKPVWRLRLPNRLHRANGLDVFVRYEHGDASFLGGLNPSR